MDMRITAKNKFRTLVILLLILAVTVSTALWSVLRTRDGAQEAYADTQAADIAATINGAKPWGDVSSVTVGNGAGDNGVVVTIGESDAVDENGIVLKEIVLKTGAQAVVNETLPSAQHELEGTEVYSLVVFDVPVTVQSEAKLTLNADVVFRAGVKVDGTLEINGMAFNQKRDGDYENNGVMTVSNTLNKYSEIKSEGVIVNGSLNNDGARGGTITVSDGSALTVKAGGALFLKADNNNALGVEGTINNNGSVIYQRAATVNFSLAEKSKAAIPATFISSLSLSGDDDGRYVFYPEKPDTGEGTALPAGDGTAFTLLNGGTRNWSGVTLLSFGRTTLENSVDNAYYTFTNVNLGGSASGDFTQGANELIFDGGAVWTQGDSDGYDLHFLVGSDSSTRVEYYNDGRYSDSALVTVNAGATLNIYGGVKITRHETRAGNGVGGGVSVKSSVVTHDSWGSTYIDSITRANLNMYGGEISYNAVTQCKNNGAGAGVYGYFAEINIAGGKITRNANATYSDGSADGAGLALDASSLTMSGGEISWNCGAVGGTDAGADGGGIIARSEDHNTAVTDETLSTLTASTVTLSGGSISNNWTGGSGGGILLWQSHLTMTGGEIAENGASFGGGIGMTSGKQHTGDDSTSKAGYARINGGTISGNYAFYNEWNTKKPQGGYGGGICVGSNIDAGDNYKLHSFVEFSGEALVTDNRAVYGGGLAVYTKNDPNYNKIIMTGGTVTGNSVEGGNAENGNGVYVYCVSNTFTQSEGMLRLSGNASIDTSNNVSFNFNFGTIPIYIYSSGTTLYYCEHNGIWGEHTEQENGLFFYNNAFYIKEGSAPYEEYYDDIINGTLTSAGYGVLFSAASKSEPVASSDRHLWYTGSHTVFDVNDAFETYSISGIYEAVRSNSLNISAPITVENRLQGTQLASLVYLGNDGVTSLWQGKDIISYSNSATVNRNKFLLDSAEYTFTETSNALQIAAAEGNENSVASVVHTEGTVTTETPYPSLAEAVAAAKPGDTIQILRSATLDKTIVVDKDITIEPDGDFTLYIKSGFDTSGAINPALFRVENGATLTLGGQNTLTVSGNTSEENIPLVTVINGSYVQKSGVTLTGASVNDDAEIHNVQTDASAIYLASSNASATIEGGVIRSNKGGLGAIYVGDGASLTLSGGAIGGTLDTDHNVDKNGLEYGVYVTGRGKVSLNGSVALYDAINLSAKGASVTVGAGYVNALPETLTETLTENDTIRLTYADSFDADDVVVNILNTYKGDAGTVFSDFALYEMDESLYALRLRGSSDGDSKNALVVQKAVRYIFDFRYQNGYSDDTLVSGMGYSGGSMKNAIEGLIQSLNGTVFANDGRIMSREETLVVYVFSGSESFSLGNLKTFAQKEGWTLSAWHRGSADSVLSAIGDSASLAYTNSSAPIELRSVWTPNQFNITFDSNYTGLGSGAQPSLIEGTMESQIVDYSDLETSNQEARLTVNNYTAVGFLFAGWSLTRGTDASTQFTDKQKLSADDWDTMIGGVIGVEHEATETEAGYVEYSITLYAVWENLFSGGVGTSANPFKIGKIEDLYILEATTMGTHGSSDSGVRVPNEYYNTHSEDGAAVAYAAENYEGYYFLLTADLTGFKGVIGRTSSKNVAAETQDAEITASLPQSVSAGNTGITENGTPFAGTFNGDGKSSIGLAINKQQLTQEQYEKALADAGGELPWENGDETLLGAGLFGYTVGATISNLTLTGSVHGYSHVGGLVGYAVNTAISSIYNEAAVSSGGHDVGGIVGTYFVTDESETQYVITNVVNTGAISYAPRLDDKTTTLSEQTDWSETKKLSDVQGIRFGGIVGYGITMRLTGGYNTGSVTGRYAVGGVVGILHSLNNNTTSDTTLTNSFNTGAVTATAGLYATVNSADGGVNAEAVNAYVGGLVGRAVGASAIDTAFNSGRVTASWTGVKNTSGEYAGKYVYADLSVTLPSADSEYIGARGAGGIVGFTSYDKNANEGDLKSIANVYNTGTISAWASVGGIAGYFAYSTVSRAYNGGSVLANGFHFEGGEQVWGGMRTSDDSYHAFLGSLVGMSIGSSLSDVYYNTDKRYEHFTDETLRQIGDYEYTAETLGFAESTFSSDRGRTASQMSVIAANNRPSGFGTDFSGTYWSFLYYADQTTDEAGQAEEGQPVEGQTYHYPQLNAFAGDGNTVTIGGRSFELGTYSKDSTLVTVPANGGENDKPITDTDLVTISYSLGGGAFTFAGGSKENGYYFTENGYLYKQVGGLWQTEVEYKISGGEAHEELAQLEQPGDPARVGYRFTGWYSDAACREPFSFGSIPASDKTVYAGWEAVTYTFVYEEFSSRGASFVGEHDATFSILDADAGRQPLPTAENVTRRGYTLSGWLYNNKAVDSYRVIAPSSGTPYIEFYSGGSENAVETVPFNTIVNQQLYLTAVWEAQPYTITYNGLTADKFVDSKAATLNGAKDSYTITDAITFAKPQKKGYTFNGWKLVSLDGKTATEDLDSINKEHYVIGDILTGIVSGTVGNIVLEAQWTRNYVTLYLDARGGTIKDYTGCGLGLDLSGRYYISVPYYSNGNGDGALAFLFNEDETFKVTATLPASSGRQFNGWYTVVNPSEGNAAITKNYIVTGDAAGTGSQTIYAGYQTKPYTITISLGDHADSVNSAMETELRAAGFDCEGDFATAKEFTLTGVLHGSSASEALELLASAIKVTSGWNFLGWVVTGSNESAPAPIYNVTSDLKITAQYEENKVAVNFVGLNGELLGSVTIGQNTAIGENNEAYKAIATKAKSYFGYEFDGSWYYTDASGDPQAFKITDTVSASMVVYANLQPRTITPQFRLVIDGMDQSISLDGYTYSFGATFGEFPTLSDLLGQLSAEDAKKYLGYQISGWSVDGSAVNVNTVITQKMVEDSETSLTIELHAELTKATYTISFIANGGSFQGVTPVGEYQFGDVDSVRYHAGNSDWDPGLPIPKRAGHTYAWNVYDANGTRLGDTPIEDVAGLIKLLGEVGYAGNISLRAEWTAEKYTVWFSANGGTFTVPEKAIDGITFYAADQTTKVTAENQSQKPAVYFTMKVQYGTVPNPPVALDAPQQNGYIFLGWRTSDNMILTEVTSEGQYSQGSPIQAYWTEGRYSITFVTNGGTTISDITEISYGADLSAQLEGKTTERDGYTFAGWYYDSGFVKSVGDSDTMPSKDLVLYAKWDVKSYKLTLNITIDGGTVEESVVKGAFKELGFTVSVAPATNGYTVEITVPYETNLSALNTIKFGENGEYSLSGTWTQGNVDVLLTFMPADNYEVSGTFTTPEKPSESVTVTFYLTDGTEYYSTTVSSGTVIGKLPEPTRTGYEFIEWRTAEGEKFEFTTQIDEDTTLYAHWKANEYTVTLRGEGVNLDPNPIEVAFGTELLWGTENAPLPVPARGGYTFEGWYLDADFSTTAEGTAMPAYDITLYAKWKATEYSIVFEWGLESEKTTVTIDGAYNSALDFSSVGGAVPHYTFIWQVTADGKDPIPVTLDDFRTMPNLSEKFAGYTSVVEGRVSITVQAAYTPIGYTITLDGADPVPVTVKDASSEKTEFAKLGDKTGYEFAGWKLSTDDTAAYYNYYAVGENGGEWGVWLYPDKGGASGHFVPFNEGFSLILTAAYTPKEYTVNFNANGGSVTTSDKKVTYDSVYGDLPVPTRVGYTFDGWFTEQEGGTQITANDVVKITADQTLFAHWTAIEYKIVYYTGSGTNHPDNKSVYTIESEFKFEDPTAPEGYTFVCWLNAANNEKISGITEGRTGDLTLIARYSPITYTVTFDKNVGDGETTTQGFTYGTAQNLSANAFTRTGYTFAGWATEEDATKVKYENGVSVINLTTENDGKVTLYAVWTANSYTVHFDANGGEGTMDDMPFTYGTAQNLSANAFTRTGYTFAGWARSNSAEVMYTDGVEVSNLTSRNGATVTLYAVWEANSVSVTFDFGDGLEELADDTATFGQSYTFTLTAKSGYSRPATVTVTVGEQTYRVAVGAGGAVVIPPVYVTDDITITAVGVADSYTIVFVGGESVTGAMNNQTVLYNIQTKLTANGFVKLGYKFLGWAYSDGAKVAIADGGLITINESFAGDIQDKTITLYAVWSPIEYTLKLEANGGNFVDEKLSSVKGTYSGNFALPDAKAFKAREGYTFLGWSTSASGESVLYNGGASVPVKLFTDGLAAAGTVGTLYAVWAKNSYTVMFNANGGTGNMGDMTFTYGTAQNLSANAFTRTGYTFDGWATDPKTTEKVYEDGESVSNLSKENGGRVTLYAVWKANTYTIAYEDDGVNIASESGTFGSAITLKDPTRPGFIFLGWYIGDDEGTRYRGSVSVGMLASAAGVANGETITLHAKWQAAEGALTVTIVHADESQQTIGVTSGKHLSKAEINVPKGYDYTYATYHIGSEQGEVFKFKDPIANDMTLYVANAEHITYNITLNYGYGDEVKLTVAYGQPLDSAKGWEETPVRIGYEFGGWYNGETRMTGGSIVTGALTLPARWTANTYTVTFNPNGGSGEQTTRTYHYGDAVAPIDAPVRDGYTFEGWYYNGKLWESGTTMPAENITLVAMWARRTFTVSFSVGDGATGVADQTIYFGFKATKPTDPVRSGYSFGGWMLNESEYDFGTPVRDNITLTAKWLPRTYSIDYVLGGGMNASSNPASYNIESGTIVLADPAREGFIFLGWYDAEQNGNRVTEIKAGSTGRITLYARWQANTYIVDFVLNGGTMKNTEQIVVAGGTVAFEEPTRENYLFMGWFTDAACTQRYDFSTPVTGDLTLYAKWRLSVISGTASDGTIVTITSDDGFDDGTTIRFTEVTDETTLSEAAGSLAENMTLARLFDIELIAADGTPVSIDKPLSVDISVQGLADAVGRYAVVYVPDGGGTIEEIATHIGEDGRMYFFVEHFSFYAVVDVLDIAPTGGFAWWWILVAVAGCAALAGIIVLLARSMRRYELNYVNGGVPAQKLKESALVDLPLPEREEEVFDGWYYDEMFRDRATLTSMPKQNLILFAKWRKMTEEERAARDRARAEAAAAAAEGFHEAKPKKEKKHKENPLNEIKEDE